jgi:hypothetical protein
MVKKCSIVGRSRCIQNFDLKISREETTWCKWESSTEMDLTEICCEDVNWTELPYRWTSGHLF